MKSSSDANVHVVIPGEGPVVPSAPLVGLLPITQLSLGKWGVMGVRVGQIIHFIIFLNEEALISLHRE